MRTWLAGMVAMVVAMSGAQADEPSRVQEARQHYLQGNRHYNLAEYDLAVDEFKKAYNLTEKPGFLFNIAQAYRLGGKCALALQFYKNYLRLEPASKSRADVERYVEEMQTCVRRDQPSSPTPTPATQPTVTPVAPAPRPAAHPATSPPPPEEEDHLLPRWSPWATLGVAVLAAGAGTYFGLRTMDTGVSDGAAEQAATRANISFSVAGLAALGTAGLFIW